MLTRSTRPEDIDTGVPGLSVTTIRVYPRNAHVTFNNESLLDHPAKEGLREFEYRLDGVHEHYPDRMPKLTLRQPAIDWTKPILNRMRPTFPVELVTLVPERNLAAIASTYTDGTPWPVPVWVDMATGETASARPSDGQFRVKIENAPPEPVVVKRDYRVQPNGDVYWIASCHAPRPSEAKIEITLTDGIVTDARVVTANRTKHDV